MATIMDYLDWRGDLTFDRDPFNEVDNLILSEMVYTDFDGIVPSSMDESISVREASEAFFQMHSREELLARESFIKMAPFVLEKMSATARFGDIKLSGYVNYIDTRSEAQMAVVSCFLPDGTVYAAFRGTDDTVIGWKEDFNLSFMDETEGQRRAVDYLNTAFKGRKVKMRVGGHSKGGNFAVYASAFARSSIRKKIIAVYTNDGPGFRPEVTERPEYREILPRVISTVPEGTIVSVLLENDVHHRVIKSSAGGVIQQHDATTWQVMGKHFVTAEGRDESSRVFDKTMRSWLSGLPDTERESFVQSLFSILSATGASTLEDIAKDPIRSGTEIIRSMRGMAKEDQEEFRSVLGKLLKSGQDAVARAARKKLGLEETPDPQALPETLEAQPDSRALTETPETPPEQPSLPGTPETPPEQPPLP